MNDDRIVSLLTEMRDNQRQALEHQRAHLQIAQSHFEQAKSQIAESLNLQRVAVSRQRTMSPATDARRAASTAGWSLT